MKTDIEEKDESYRQWLWDAQGERCLKNLKKHGFDVHWAPDMTSARDTALKLAEGCRTFGFGGSSTTRALGLPMALKEKGGVVYDHWEQSSEMTDLELRLAQGRCDCFFCSANAVSMTGEIINVDGVGNRNNAMTFGCKKVVVIAGMNKVAKDLHSALSRIKEVAAPMRAKSLNMETPCTQTGVCSDCNAPQRICRITTILHRKPMMTDVSVILIPRSIGF